MSVPLNIQYQFPDQATLNLTIDLLAEAYGGYPTMTLDTTKKPPQQVPNQETITQFVVRKNFEALKETAARIAGNRAHKAASDAAKQASSGVTAATI